ncbi:unnamed protein product [Trifolium pratense]|uniref:Uncharacterized protein n=1 Tax=Trifolium pratense TaxID=57577 RepID=A0ACB0KH24_TRIPR|nr:unnamed protein product [Trifolium pratense]
MGSEISKGVDGLGSAIGSAFTAPFKSVFGGSCQDICSGPLDVMCFIEHFCISSIVKLLMILVLCYICLLFLYSLFRLGICQCIGRSLCKMCCVTCELSCFALLNITSNLWHKLINTKRVYRGIRRRRFQHDDVELGYTSPSTDHENNSLCDYRSRHFGRKRKSLRERSRRNGHSVHLSRMKGKSWRVESSRKIQLSKVRNQRGKTTIIKRRRHKR